VSTGATLSVTVTVKMQVPVLGTVSVAVQVTVVTPFRKAEPDVGEQVTLRVPSQLSWPRRVVADRRLALIGIRVVGDVCEGNHRRRLSVVYRGGELSLPSCSLHR
jgi:hypothetical protein